MISCVDSLCCIIISQLWHEITSFRKNVQVSVVLVFFSNAVFISVKRIKEKISYMNLMYFLRIVCNLISGLNVCLQGIYKPCILFNLPAMPSTYSPLTCWNVLTALSVLAPKSPSKPPVS